MSINTTLCPYPVLRLCMFYEFRKGSSASEVAKNIYTAFRNSIEYQ